MRRAYDALGIQCPTTTPGLLPSQTVGRGVRMPGPGIQGPPGSMQGVRLALPPPQGVCNTLFTRIFCRLSKQGIF